MKEIELNVDSKIGRHTPSNIGYSKKQKTQTLTTRCSEDFDCMKDEAINYNNSKVPASYFFPPESDAKRSKKLYIFKSR